MTSRNVLTCVYEITTEGSPQEVAAALKRRYAVTAHVTQDGSCIFLRVGWPWALFGRQSIGQVGALVSGWSFEVPGVLRCRWRAIEGHGWDRGLSRGARPVLLSGLLARARLTSAEAPRALRLLVRDTTTLGALLQRLHGAFRLEGPPHVLLEDALLAHQSWCPAEQRYPAIGALCRDVGVAYVPALGGPEHGPFKGRVAHALHCGVAGLSLSVGMGLSHVLDLRRQTTLPLFLWLPQPTAPILTLFRWAGADALSVGMYGGPWGMTTGALWENLGATVPSLPWFEGEMTTERRAEILRKFGTDLMTVAPC